MAYVPSNGPAGNLQSVAGQKVAFFDHAIPGLPHHPDNRPISEAGNARPQERQATAPAVIGPVAWQRSCRRALAS